jgi:hypothetical protein
MNQTQIFFPCVALVALTSIVWVRLYIERIGEMRSRRIKPQSISTSGEVSQALQHVKASDTFSNLFEVPVLFYVLCISLAVTQTVTPWFVYGAWAFVVLRAAHAFINITYNRVMHRFYAYAASTVLLFVMWAGFGVRLLSA